MFVLRALFWLSAMAFVVPQGAAMSERSFEQPCLAGSLACDGPVNALGQLRAAGVDRVLAFKHQRQEARRLAEQEEAAGPAI